ncbi:MAG TPA: lipopolysaccharide heptosyltransferase I [Sulfurovum sp.]|nr:lipopolysaccharide heptosyltransferase I [Sulfurovum sp.]
MKIAIVKLSAMGDIVHAMVALQFLKKADPSLQIDWVVEEGFAGVLEGNPHIDNILPVNLKAIKKNKMALFTEIKRIKSYAKNNYDLVIDAQGLIKSAITAKLLGKKVVGFSKNSIREGFASYFYTQTIDIPYEKNAIERNMKVLCEPLHITVSQEDILQKEKFLYFSNDKTYKKENESYVLLVVGASVPNKMYPKEKFLALAESMEENIVAVWGNEAEKEIALYLTKNTENVTISPKLTLNALKRTIAHAKLVIGGDTGPTHMAWGLNVPSITLFGNTPSERNTYITDINKVICSETKVDAVRLDKSDFSIREIDPGEITSIAKEILDA